MKFGRALFLFILSLVFIFSNGQAQDRPGQGLTVTGVVVDDTTEDPLASSTVAVWNTQDSTLVTGTITEADGSFNISSLRPGAYYVQVSFVGYTTTVIDNVTLQPGERVNDLGQIALQSDTQLMDDVEVTAERNFMEVSIDRTVYNTKDQPVTAGGNAADVLQNIPSVEVDIDGNISLRGSQNVAILVNGRPTPLQGEALTSFLRGLPSDALERVEVIPNPSAKYEPDGMSGILNIVLEQDQELGLSGSATTGIATSSTYSASSNINYQTGPWNLFTGYSYRTSTRDNLGNRYRENRFSDPLTILETDNSGEGLRQSHNLRSGIDYNLDKETTIGLQTRLGFRGGGQDEIISYTELTDARDPYARYDRITTGDRSDFDTDVRLSYRKVKDPSNHEFTAELQFEAEWEEDQEDYTQNMIVDGASIPDLGELENNLEEEQGQEAALQIDYMRPLGEDRKLELGYKGDFRRLDSRLYAELFDEELGGYIPDLTQNNEFIYDQIVNAAYGIVGGEFGDFGLQVGLRAEQAVTDFNLETTDETYDNNYFSLFPSAFLTYELAEGKTFKASYSKRINRPRTYALNPFNGNRDPFFRRVGNPNLQPEYIHSFEVGFTRFGEKTSITLTPYFRYTVDVIERRETVDQNGISTLTFENFDTSKNWGAEVITTLKLGRRLNGYLSFNAYKVNTDGSSLDTELSNNAFGYNARMNGTINLLSNLALQLTYFYRSGIDLPDGGRISSFTMTDIALRQRFWDDKASLSLRVSDLFDTMGFNLLRDDDLFYQESFRKWDSQNVYMTFTYNFGRQDRRNNRRNNDGGGGDMGGGDDIEFGG